jgi:hypothetical protein
MLIHDSMVLEAQQQQRKKNTWRVGQKLSPSQRSSLNKQQKDQLGQAEAEERGQKGAPVVDEAKAAGEKRPLQDTSQMEHPVAKEEPALKKAAMPPAPAATATVTKASHRLEEEGPAAKAWEREASLKKWVAGGGVGEWVGMRKGAHVFLVCLPVSLSSLPGGRTPSSATSRRVSAHHTTRRPA